MPKKPIMLTFDAGNYCKYENTFPLMKKYNIKVTFFLQLKNLNTPGHLTSAQITEMNDSGLAVFGNHTYDLHRLRKVAKYGNLLREKGESMEAYRERVTTDLMKVQDFYADLGINTWHFAYPNGKHDKSSKKVLGEMGFETSFTCRVGLGLNGANYLTKKSNLSQLNRITRPHKMGTKLFYNWIT